MTIEARVRSSLRRVAEAVGEPDDAWWSIECGRSEPPPALHRGRLGAIVVATIVSAASFVLLWNLWLRESNPADLASPSGGATVQAVTSIELPGTAAAIASSSSAVWVSIPATSDNSRNLLLRVGPDTDAIEATIETPEPVYALAASEGALWGIVSDAPGSQTLVRFDEASGDVTASLPGVIAPIALGLDSVWAIRMVSDSKDGDAKVSVVRLTPDTLTVSAEIDVPGSVSALAIDNGDVWALVENSRGTESIVRIDAHTNEVITTVETEALYGHLSVAGGKAWLSSPTLKQPSYLDSATNRVVLIDIQTPQFYPFAATEEGVWFAQGDQVCFLNAAAEQVDACVASSFASLHPTSAVLQGTRSVWIATSGDAMKHVEVGLSS